jgi:hypothetical protein
MSLKVMNKMTLGERIDRAVAAVTGDLSLLFSLYSARILVRLTLRRRDRERAKAHAARRKQFGRATDELLPQRSVR